MAKISIFFFIKRLFYIAIAVLIIIDFSLTTSYAQAYSHSKYGVFSVLAASGSSSQTLYSYTRWTIGQTSPTNVVNSNSFQIRQGFQQPRGVFVQKKLIDSISLNLYPNPNNGCFSIEIMNMIDSDFQYFVHSLNGRQVFSGYGKSNQINAVCPAIPLFDGSYIISVLSRSQPNSVHKKFVVIH